MANNYEIVIGVDPGVVGGISILYKNGVVDIKPMPVKSVVINKKNKKVYDIESIAEILRVFKEKCVLFVQEKVSSHPGEGSVSAFGFGKSAGLTIGAATAFGFKVVEVTPATWKRHFPSLTNEEITGNKEKVKELMTEAKTLKDKEAKKENKKQIDKLHRQVKSIAKNLARELISSRYPQLGDMFEKKNSDGMAESLLIALYGRDNQDELVQTG